MDVVLETEGEASELVDGIVRELKDGGSVRREVLRAIVAHTAGTILDVAKEEGAGLSSCAPAGSRTGSAARWERCPQGRPLADLPVLIVQ
jgi:hypothetical protein